MGNVFTYFCKRALFSSRCISYVFGEDGPLFFTNILQNWKDMS